jgi:hypothetical protein
VEKDGCSQKIIEIGEIQDECRHLFSIKKWQILECGQFL